MASLLNSSNQKLREIMIEKTSHEIIIGIVIGNHRNILIELILNLSFYS